MSNAGRNVIIIVIVSGAIVFFSTRDKKLFAKKNKDDSTEPPATSDQNAVEDKDNAATVADAVRMAIGDEEATGQDMQDLKDSIFDKYGLSVVVDADNNIQVKSRSGKLILQEPV